ncbi:hypothetical protein EZS27_010724 [termite gut metagenome]|uniref:Gylcosyl hydrolase 115 C-terminal domain-containing protein n=1 Tax=termite gut metagenome TaxID=433724 RepID=A0A5J4S7Z1_9ZZZZ
MKNLQLLLILIAANIQLSFAQVSLSNRTHADREFELIGGKTAQIYYDDDDFEVVKKATELLGDDVHRVTGQRLPIGTLEGKLSSNSIIVGTLGKNSVIDEFVRSKKIDVSQLSGKWESYLVQLVLNPTPGVKKALVIAGSDRRGTAYGVFSVSEAIGVSPWYWWLDAPVVKRAKLVLQVDRYQSAEPTVRYRGIFINDEDWGLFRWVRDTFEKDRKNIGPKTYAKVCELLLRLKANYLCPAMHNCSTAFNAIDENKVVADSYGIVMGSVHCEPLLFNNATEWDKKTMGEWNYVTNKDGINRVLRERVTNNASYENVYTLALRGLHDSAMAGSNDMKERVKQLDRALNDQRQILVDVLQKPATEIPQAFTPYKEVLDVYSAGLDLPDDVTIIWPDDNYGYMKRLSSPREQKRSGRSGVYYHVSYLGKPHDYLWISTTPPVLMYEELRKAYDTTADRVWLLNVGDIKSCEFSMDLFLSMGYNIDAFDYDNVATYYARWLSRMFGEKYYEQFVDITQSFYRLAFSRKPEFMGFGYRWATNKHPRERNTDTDFSFANYREAERRIDEYDRIGNGVSELMNLLPEDQKPVFYQTLYYPVKGCELLNKMVLYGQKNRWYALQQRASANFVKDEVKVCYDSLQIITDGYNSLLDGKWNQVMTMAQGGGATYFEMPNVEEISLPSKPVLGIWTENQDILKGEIGHSVLPSFNTFFRESYFFEVYNKGSQPLGWSLDVSDDWIIVSRKSGNTLTEERVYVSVDWDKAPKGERITGTIRVKGNRAEDESVLVSVFNPVSPTVAELSGLFVEHNGYVSIDAAGFDRKTESSEIRIKTIPNMGFEGTAIQLGNPMAPMQHTNVSTVPCVEYDFYTFHRGSVDVYTYVLPTFILSNDLDYAGHEATNIETRYGVCMDDGPVMNPSTSSFEYAQNWYESALKNCRINKTTLHINKPGKHTVKILCGNPGTVIQKIVLDFGGLKRSYLGPEPTNLN